MKSDIECMQMALELAGRGLGNLESNPAVGCVMSKTMLLSVPAALKMCGIDLV